MSALGAVLADRHRFKVALALLLFLVGSGGYWAWLTATLQLGDWHAIAYPAQHPGEEVVLSLWEVEALHPPSRYQLGKSRFSVVVDGPTAGLAPGEELSFGVEIRPDGSFAERWREAHPARPAKNIAAFTTLGFLLVFLPVAFRVRGGRVVPRG